MREQREARAAQSQPEVRMREGIYWMRIDANPQGKSWQNKQAGNYTCWSALARAIG